MLLLWSHVIIPVVSVPSVRARPTHRHTDRVHVNMSSINMYVGRERSSGLIKMTCYVTFL